MRNIKEEKSFRNTLKEDLKNHELLDSIKMDWNEMYDYFLDAHKKEKLGKMSAFKRFFYKIVWLLRALFLKLSSTRRILLLISIFLFFIEVRVDEQGGNGGLIPLIILLFVLMLELKDKLLAKEELEIGRRVQHAFMPEETPNVKGWDVFLYSHPAKEVGGDMVDVFEYSKERYLSALGDVSGKGLGAALLMVKLQSTLRALSNTHEKLYELMNSTNRIFHRDIDKKSFASLFLAAFDSDSNSIRICNAGHIPPILIQDCKIRELKKGEMALGMTSMANYSQMEFKLNENDMLLVYSDGVSEMRNEKGQFFGDFRIKNTAVKNCNKSAKQIGEALIDNLSKFRDKQHYYDDVSILIIKRK